MKDRHNDRAMTRRQALKLGLVAGGSAILTSEVVDAKRRRRRRDRDDDDDDREDNQSSSGSAKSCTTAWQQPLRVPKIAQSRTPGAVNALDPHPGNYPGWRVGDTQGGPADTGGGFDNVAHGIAREFDNRVPGFEFPCRDWNRANDELLDWQARTHEKEYKLITEETLQEIVPGKQTPVFAYRDAFAADSSGPAMTPGPTFVSRYREPVVVRNENHLTAERGPTNTTHHDHETSIHLHGTHAPAHGDGYPDFYVLAGEARDYFYPNIAPRETDPDTNVAPACDGDFDETWIPSTLWYHDHGMDVTGFNVARGLAGFYLVFDDREIEMITGKGSGSSWVPPVLPPPGRDALKALGVSTETIDYLLGTTEAEPGENDAGFDFGLALQDQQMDSKGNIVYDFLDHDGRIGNVMTVNGTAQPFMEVQRRKYRFRVLNASNARIYHLRLSSGKPFTIFGADSWLFPIAGDVKDFEVAMGQRHDVIIDFSDYNAGDEVCLQNIMEQDDGRKGEEDLEPGNPTHLLKFIVKEANPGLPDDVTIAHDSLIRGFKKSFRKYAATEGGQWAPIPKREIVKKRRFKFDRDSGAWTINERFFNPRRADASPVLGTAEQWTLENDSGGWWHPIHTHLEGFQIIKTNGRKPPFERSFNSDLANLHGDEVAKVYIKFRTFTGPFVFHCHNIEHEDMRMMGTHDPHPLGKSPLNGVKRVDPEVSGVVPSCLELEEEGFLYFDAVGDLDELEDEGVGFPHCEFKKNKD